MALGVPARVQGHAADGEAWEEMTTTVEASFGGASFHLRHAVEPGQVLQLSLPLPKTFRRYDVSEPSYRVYALVRNRVAGESDLRIGVFFLGRTPPKGYAENPGGRYLLPTDPPPRPRERRSLPRFEAFLNMRIRREPIGSEPPQEERTVAENICLRGARVLTSLPIAKGERLTVHELDSGFETSAEVKNIYIGTDRVPRLNLHFLAEAPARLVSL